MILQLFQLLKTSADFLQAVRLLFQASRLRTVMVGRKIAVINLLIHLWILINKPLRVLDANVLS